MENKRENLAPSRTQNTLMPLAPALGLAGLIPFWAPVLAGLLDLSVLGQSPVELFTAYSAVILAFLCGTLWAAAVLVMRDSARGLLIGSNVLALLAWVALLLNHTLASLLLLTLGFVLVLTKEHHVFEHMPKGYRHMRYGLSGAVVLAHFAMLAIFS